MANRVAPAQPRAEAKAERLLYLYGVTEAAVPGLHIAAGIDGNAAVEALACSGHFCWISRVDPVDFGDQLQARMENLDWLAGASVRHQNVVGAIHERATILPARFATIFRTDKSLAADITRRGKDLRRSFARLSGSDEYGIKIFGIPPAATLAQAPRSGADYLRQKSEILRDRGTVKMTPEVERFLADVEKIAAERAPGGKVTSGQKNLLWQASFLVPRSRRKQLESALAAFHRKHGEQFRAECTGPWPPYSFVAIRSDEL